jgi:hypothetical protein
MTSSPRRFVFHGHACAYSGRLYRPKDIVIPAPAASALSVSGGRSAATGRSQRFDPYLSVGPAATMADAAFTNRKAAVAMTHGRVPEATLSASTVLSAEVSRIAADSKRLRVGLVRGGLVASSPTKRGQPPIRIARGSTITDVSIDGYGLAVILDLKRFEGADTFAALSRMSSKASGQVFERHEGLIYTTIVKQLKWKGKPHPTAQLEGHCLYVPGFGRVYFGELTAEHSARRLTMLRLHLGSPISIRVGFSDVGANGSWYPPTT